jgi:hypothetical protein
VLAIIHFDPPPPRFDSMSGIMSSEDTNIEYFNKRHAVLQDARNLHTGYFERLALLDGGTVALVVSAVVGPLHSQLKHRYTLGVGLTMLVLAMGCLMIRNYYAVKIEMIIAVRQYGSTIGEPGRLRVINREFVDKWALSGSVLTLTGMLILLLEVWMILL